MISALERGGHGKADKGNIGCVNVTVTRGEVVKKSENFANVIYGSPLREYPRCHFLLRTILVRS